MLRSPGLKPESTNSVALAKALTANMTNGDRFVSLVQGLRDLRNEIGYGAMVDRAAGIYYLDPDGSRNECGPLRSGSPTHRRPSVVISGTVLLDDGLAGRAAGDRRRWPAPGSPVSPGSNLASFLNRRTRWVVADDGCLIRRGQPVRGDIERLTSSA